MRSCGHSRRRAAHKRERREGVDLVCSAEVGSTRSAEDIRKEREFTRAYLGFTTEPIHWVFIRAVLASVADIAIVPLQDVLGLGTEARMNLPGTTSANWRWRYPAGATGRLHREHEGKSVVRIYDYVDGSVPIMAKMYERRLAGYKSIGYRIVE